MIGMSLQFMQLLSNKDEDLRPEIILPKLWEHGVRSIEFRSVSPSHSPADVLRIANVMWDYGFNITVHGETKSAQTAVEDVFAPLSDMLANLRQRELVITVHPIVDDTVEMLLALSDYIIEHNYPVRIALENNRKMPDKTIGDSVALVLDAVMKADRKNVGICFDMGHYAWYTANHTDTPDMLPPKKFLSRVIHTHIHAYAHAVNRTHFPLDEWREPFSRYIEALDCNYLGVFNVELEPKRFKRQWSATEGFLMSADTLRSHYPSRALYNDNLRQTYDGYFCRSLEVLNKKEGCYVSLLSPSSYLLSTNGYKWGMDITFETFYGLAETPSKVREYLGGLDCIFLTHAHSDHMEERTIRALADTDISWVLPEFLLDKVMEFGVSRDKITVVREGDDISVGPLHIKVLKGRHIRPATGKGAPAVGYFISADNAPTLAFPGDIRDYSITDDEALNADHCFAHVWLTDRALEPEMYIPKSVEFARFMLLMSRKSIFLTHLNTDRKDDKRWTVHHAQVASASIREQSPDTVVRVPKYGEIFDLSTNNK